MKFGQKAICQDSIPRSCQSQCTFRQQTWWSPWTWHFSKNFRIQHNGEHQNDADMFGAFCPSTPLRGSKSKKCQELDRDKTLQRHKDWGLSIFDLTWEHLSIAATSTDFRFQCNAFMLPHESNILEKSNDKFGEACSLLCCVLVESHSWSKDSRLCKISAVHCVFDLCSPFS